MRYSSGCYSFKYSLVPRCSTRTKKSCVAKMSTFSAIFLAILRTVWSNFCHRLVVRQVLSTLSAKNTPPATDWIASQIQRDQRNVIDCLKLLRKDFLTTLKPKLYAIFMEEVYLSSIQWKISDLSKMNLVPTKNIGWQ